MRQASPRYDQLRTMREARANLRRPRPLSAAEVKAIADRAEGRALSSQAPKQHHPDLGELTPKYVTAPLMPNGQEVDHVVAAVAARKKERKMARAAKKIAPKQEWDRKTEYQALYMRWKRAADPDKKREALEALRTAFPNMKPQAPKPEKETFRAARDVSARKSVKKPRSASRKKAKKKARR